MKWALKFTTKGKRDGSGGPDSGKPYNHQADSFRNGGGSSGGGGGVGGEGQGGFRSSSDGEGEENNREHDLKEEQGAEGSTNSRTPIVTPPDANGEGSRAGTAEKEGRLAGHSSAPPFTVDSAGRRTRVEGEKQDENYPEARAGDDWIEMDGEGGGDRLGERRQDGVFDDDDSPDDADSLHASKTARIKSFADDPDAHNLEDNHADWDGERSDDTKYRLNASRG